MDVVVDGHLIMSQDKNIEEQSQNIVTGKRVRGERACFQIAAITSINAWKQDCNGLPVYAFDITRRIAGVELNAPSAEKFSRRRPIISVLHR
jgi:hypothetical protein